MLCSVLTTWLRVASRLQWAKTRKTEILGWGIFLTEIINEPLIRIARILLFIMNKSCKMFIYFTQINLEFKVKTEMSSIIHQTLEIRLNKTARYTRPILTPQDGNSWKCLAGMLGKWQQVLFSSRHRTRELLYWFGNWIFFFSRVKLKLKLSNWLVLIGCQLLTDSS